MNTFKDQFVKSSKHAPCPFQKTLFNSVQGNNLTL
jgi:hypothetical protein